LLTVLRPLLVRGSVPYGQRTLEQVKSPLFIVIFAVIVRLLAFEGVTVFGRIFYASVTSVLLIVGVTWLTVRVTRLVAQSSCRAGSSQVCSS
jgi:hypothetical protein